MDGLLIGIAEVASGHDCARLRGTQEKFVPGPSFLRTVEMMSGAQHRAGPPRKHAALTSSACFRRGCLGFAVVATRGESMAPATTRCTFLRTVRCEQRRPKLPNAHIAARLHRSYPHSL